MATTQTTTFPATAGMDVAVTTWASLAQGETGDAVVLSVYSDRSVQFSGVWGGATAVLQGSNDGTTYETLTDPQTVAISKTANALEAITELTLYARPKITGGDGTTNLKVVMVGRKSI